MNGAHHCSIQRQVGSLQRQVAFLLNYYTVLDLIVIPATGTASVSLLLYLTMNRWIIYILPIFLSVYQGFLVTF